MAKIETTFIRPKELYTPETGETKVVYDGYQNNPHELVVQENLESDVSEIVNDTFVPNEGGNVVFTDNNETEHELITENGFPTALAKAQVIATTWADLKDLRDNKQLIAGSLYRITDYQCTTTQENTQSAGHQFDIVLLALSENKLAEEGWAMMHEDIYDVTFNDGVTLKCYIYKLNEMMCNVVSIDTLKGVAGSYGEGEDVEIDNSTAVANGLASTDLIVGNLQYNYFQNSNLSAWKVWYCLDNDTDRFAWADDSVDEGSPATIEIIPSGGGLGDIETYTRDESLDVVKSDTQYYGWTAQGITPNNIYTTTEIPTQEDNLFTLNGKGTMSSYSGDIVSFTPAEEGTGLPNGRGVIYRLIDEWNNDCPYDFKNIQLYLPIVEGDYVEDGAKTWVYTFCLYNKDGGTYEDGSLKIIEVSVDDTYIVFYNIFMTANFNARKCNSIAFNVAIGYYSISDEDGFAPHNCIYDNCGFATIIGSSARLYDCRVRDFVARRGGIYYDTKKVLTEE